MVLDNSYHELIKACREDNLDKVKFLVGQGCEFTSDHDWALRLSCVNGQKHIVEYLISEGADPSACREYCLRRSCIAGNLEMIKFLISFGCDFRIDNDLPLQNACEYGRINVVKYLISLGSNFKENESIFRASSGCHLEVVKYLVSLGADIKKNINIALINATSNAITIFRCDMIRYLLQNGADATYDYYAAFEFADVRHNIEAVYMFVKYGGVPFDMISSEKCKKYFIFREKMEKKMKNRAQKKIYFWIIPKLYDLNRESGKRLMQKNWQATEALLMT
jgi:hypothetical protein